MSQEIKHRAPILVPFVLFGIVINAIVGGYTFSVLWAWFIAPVLSLPNIGIAQSAGMLVSISVFRYSHKALRDTKPVQNIYEVMSGLGYKIAFSIYVLAIGWVITLFL